MNFKKSRVCEEGGGRIDYIDFAKALGMALIIWSHIASGMSVAFAYAFHIPLFFFLSGMVFNPEKYSDFKTFFVRKIRTLIVPYIIYSVITWFIWAVYSYVTHGCVENYYSPLLETFIARGSEGYLVHNVPLWFVPCLFVVEMVYYCMNKLRILSVVISIFLAGGGFILVNYVHFFDFTTLPWSIEVSMLAMIFYCAGYEAMKFIGSEKICSFVEGHKAIAFLLMFGSYVLVVIGSILNGQPSMGHSYIGNPLLFYPVAFIGIFASLILSIMLSSSVLNQKGYLSGIRWFGRNSFTAMAVHNPIKGVIIVALAYGLHESKMAVVTSFWGALLSFSLCLVITITCMIIINKIKSAFHKRIGKR